MTPADPDLTLVQALKVGEDQALNALMERHREGLFRFVLRQVHNEDDALELATETFVRAYFNIEKFRSAAKHHNLEVEHRKFDRPATTLRPGPLEFKQSLEVPSWAGRMRSRFALPSGQN